MATHEIPDSEDDSLSSSPSNTADYQESRSESRQNGSAKPVVDTPPREGAPVPSQRAMELQYKITQLKSTVEHTEAKLGETLAKLSALSSSQARLAIGSPAKSTPTSIIKVSSLTPDQRHILNEAQKTLDTHIKKLGQYNQLKDMAMGMLGMIAEKEGKTLREVMKDRDVEDDE